MSCTVLPRIAWAIAIASSLLFYGWKGREAYSFYGDALGYYLYLPATFIYHNHQSLDSLPADRHIRPFIRKAVAEIVGGQRTPKGYPLDQYTYGVALTELPFFAVAHAWERITGGAANGFSTSYQIAVDVSAIVYCMLGLFVLFRVLRRTYGAPAASLTTALILLGTNLFWFTWQQRGMGHVPLFLLCALVLYLTQRIYEAGKTRHFVLLGLALGLITVIRPVDAVVALVPLLYRPGARFFRDKRELIRRHAAGIGLCAIAFLIPLLPQLLYWKWLTGFWIYDSYGPGQTFDFLHPKIGSGLFGYSNGWLIYSPLMLCSLAGFFLAKRYRSFAWAVWTCIPVYVWAIYSWYLSNYINSFGSRPMIDVYPLLAVPLGAVVSWGMSRKLSLALPLAAVVIFCVYVNLAFSVRQAGGTLLSQDSRYSFLLRTLFRFRLDYADLVLWDTGLSQPDTATLRPSTIVSTILSDSSYSAHVLRERKGAAKTYCLQEGEEYAPVSLRLPAAELAAHPGEWLRCSGRFYLPTPEDYIYHNHLLVFDMQRGDSTLCWYAVRLNNKIGLLEPGSRERPGLFTFRDHRAGEVAFYVPMPDGLRNDDQLHLSIWNIPKTPLCVSELSMQRMQSR